MILIHLAFTVSDLTLSLVSLCMINVTTVRGDILHYITYITYYIH